MYPNAALSREAAVCQETDPHLSQHLHDQIERCRRDFESTENFAFLLEALTYCKQVHPCFTWVVSAVDAIVATEINQRVGAVGHWVTKHERAVIDLTRTKAIRWARRHGATWRQAYEFAAEYFGPTRAGNADYAAMEQSWRRVRDGGGDESPRLVPQ